MSLVVTLRETRSALAESRLDLLGAYQPLVGATLPALINDAVRPVLTLVVSETCGVCDETWPLWEGLVSKGNAHVVVVNLTEPASVDYGRRHNLARFTTLGRPGRDIQNAYRIRHTPQTILLSSDSRVLFAKTGALSADDQHRLTEELARAAR